MKRFSLKPLPYAYDALAPIISRRTLQVHYDKHHRAYVENLNRITEESSVEPADLEVLILRAKSVAKHQALYHNAAQVWNHDFYWQSMAPGGGSEPPEELARQLAQRFGSVDAFRQQLISAASAHFGSGWLWLAALPNGDLTVCTTHDADSPLNWGAHPLYVCDLWEHAYYLDYQQDRAAYIKAVVGTLINWRFVSLRLADRHNRHAA